MKWLFTAAMLAAVLTSVAGFDYLEQLKKMGVDVDSLGSGYGNGNGNFNSDGGSHGNGFGNNNEPGGNFQGNFNRGSPNNRGSANNRDRFNGLGNYGGINGWGNGGYGNGNNNQGGGINGNFNGGNGNGNNNRGPGSFGNGNGLGNTGPGVFGNGNGVGNVVIPAKPTRGPVRPTPPRIRPASVRTTPRPIRTTTEKYEAPVASTIKRIVPPAPTAPPTLPESEPPTTRQTFTGFNYNNLFSGLGWPFNNQPFNWRQRAGVNGYNAGASNNDYNYNAFGSRPGASSFFNYQPTIQPGQYDWTVWSPRNWNPSRK